MTVVLDKSAALAGTDDGNSNSNLNCRQVVLSAALGAATGTQVRVTLLFGTAEGTETPAIDDVYVGRAAASGHAYDFNGNQVQITFSGGTTVNGSAAGSVTSDWVTLGGGELYDNTKNYVVSFHAKNGASCHFSVALAVASVDFYCDGGAASNAGTSVVTLGHFFANNSVMISKIEIQAAATAIPNKIYQTNFAVKRAAYY